MIGSTSLTAGGGPVRGGGEACRVWLATAPLDMRCGFDRLAEHVRTILLADPTSGHLFVFRGKRADRCKILWWDRNGYCIYYKRLERGTFQFPSADQKTVAVGSAELMRLLSGLSIT